jgi:hypothetical protein
VKEAIDLTDAVARIAPAQAPVVQAPVRPAAATRLLSNRSGVDQAIRPRVNRGWLVLLVLAALGAAVFHAQQWLNRPLQRPPPTLRGAPEHTLGAQTRGSSLLIENAGQRMNPADLERFKLQEEAKGNRVREIGPGAFIVEPQTAGPQAAPPASAGGSKP